MRMRSVREVTQPKLQLCCHGYMIVFMGFAKLHGKSVFTEKDERTLFFIRIQHQPCATHRKHEKTQKNISAFVQSNI